MTQSPLLCLATETAVQKLAARGYRADRWIESIVSSLIKSGAKSLDELIDHAKQISQSPTYEEISLWLYGQGDLAARYIADCWSVCSIGQENLFRAYRECVLDVTYLVWHFATKKW